MEKIKIAIVGFGNIGRGVLSAIPQNPDMELVAIFTRRVKVVGSEIKGTLIMGIDDYRGDGIDVAILCGGSKEDLPIQGPFIASASNTVDSYDTHAKIPQYFKVMDRVAKEAGKVAVTCAGWDPGLFSMMRTLFEAVLPKSQTYTFWGPGVSQGHSDAARKVEGVADARQYTIPIEAALDKVRSGKTPLLTFPKQMHKRLVYVVLKPGANQKKVKWEIVNMPDYFAPYITDVEFITAEEMKKNHSKYPHGGFVLTSGVTGRKDIESLEFSCKLADNPGFTGSVLVACARAAYRLQKKGKIGAFTMLDFPLSYFHPYSPDILRGTFV